jgi:high-affinity nickel permease
MRVFLLFSIQADVRRKGIHWASQNPLREFITNLAITSAPVWASTWLG